jgi:ABC-type lipoprotein release transport system permease subunit
VRLALAGVAARNLARNRRRTGLTVAAIALGLAALTFLWSLSAGLQRTVARNLQEAIVGSLQVHRAGFMARPELARHIEAPGEVVAALERRSARVWTERLETFALAAGRDRSVGLLLMGLDPERERQVTALAERVSVGRFLRPDDDRACVLGAATARSLRVGLGDPVTLLSYDRFGALSAENFTLVGLFTSGEAGIETGFAAVPLAAAQAFLEMEGRVTSIAIRLSEESLGGVAQELQADLAGRHLEVLRWDEMFPLVRQWSTLSEGFHYILLGVVLVIALGGVVNTLLASMLERTRELGLLMALGMKPGTLRGLVLLEATWLGALGTAVGVALGTLLVALTGYTGVDLSPLMADMGRYYLDPVIYPVLVYRQLVLSAVATLSATVLAALYPAWQTSRLEPAEALRHV